MIPIEGVTGGVPPTLVKTVGHLVGEAEAGPHRPEQTRPRGDPETGSWAATTVAVWMDTGLATAQSRPETEGGAEVMEEAEAETGQDIELMGVTAADKTVVKHTEVDTSQGADHRPKRGGEETGMVKHERSNSVTHNRAHRGE